MKQWEQNTIAAIILIVMGIGLILGANMIEVPARYRTFLGIPYDVNPDFFFAFEQVMTLLLLGLVGLGIGVGLLANTPTIYKLEKKLLQEA